MLTEYRRSGMYSRRSRRTVWWWLIPIGVVVTGTALLVSYRGTETRRETAFLDSTRALSQEVDQVAAGFRRLAGAELLTITRDDFEVLMDRLGSQMTQHADRLTEVQTPDSAWAAGEMLGLAFESWVVGLAEFRTAITEVIDDPTSTVPVDRLGSAIAQLRVGDLIYARFLDRAGTMIEDLDVAISRFPAIAFISDQRVLLNGERLARTVRTRTNLGIRRDVGILQIVFEPLPSGGLGEDGEIIFPVTDHLQFSAVIGNRGNVDQKGIGVSASITAESGESLTTTDSDTLDLAPGEIGSVLFAPVAVQPGAEYLITFNLTEVEDELNMEDNIWESQIRINPPG